MTITIDLPGEGVAWPVRALGIIARAAAGLFVHGLVRFGSAAVIERATGKVRAV